MPGLLVVVMRAVSLPVSKPTINCFAIDHALHTISGKVGAKHGISRHGMRRPELVHRRHVDDERRGMRFPVCLKPRPNPWDQALRLSSHLTRPLGVDAN